MENSGVHPKSEPEVCTPISLLRGGIHTDETPVLRCGTDIRAEWAGSPRHSPKKNRARYRALGRDALWSRAGRPLLCSLTKALCQCSDELGEFSVIFGHHIAPAPACASTTCWRCWWTAHRTRSTHRTCTETAHLRGTSHSASYRRRERVFNLALNARQIGHRGRIERLGHHVVADHH